MPSSSHDQPIYEPEATTTTTSSSSSARTALFDQAAHSHGGRVRCPPQLMQAAGSPPRLMPTPPQPPLPSASLPFSGSPHRLACSPPSSSLYPSSAAAARSMHSFARMTPELTISQHPMCRGGHADGVHTMHELTAVPASATSLTSTPNSQNKLSGGQGTSREGMNTVSNNNNNTNNSSNGSSVSSSHASSRQTRPHSSPGAAIGAAASISGTKTNRLLYGKEESDEVEAGRKAHTAMYYAGYSQGAAAAAAAERNAASPSLSSPSYTHSAAAAVVVAAAAPMQAPYLSRPGFTRSESSGNSTTAASPPALLLPTQPPPPVLSSSSPSGATMTLPVRGPVHHHHHHGLPATMAAQTQAASKPKAFLFSTSAKLVSENARFCAEGVVGAGDMAASAGADAVMASTSSHHSGSPDKQSMATTALLRSMPASSPPHAPPGQVHTDTNNSNNNYTNSNSNSGSRRHASPGQSGSSHSPSRQLLHGPSPPTTAPPPPDAARSHTRLAKLLHVAAATQPPPLLTALQPSHDPSTSAAAPATQQYLSVTAYEATGLKRNSTSSAVPSPSLDALVSYASTNTVLTSPAEAASHFARDTAAALTPLTVPAEAQRRADASQSETALAATTSAIFMNTSSSSVTSSSLAGTTPGATSTSTTAVRRVKRRPASLFISPQSVQSGEASRPHFAAVTNNNSSNAMLAGLAPGKEPSGLRRPRAMSEHALYNTTGGAAAGEQPRSNTTTATATASSSQANAMPALQPMNAFGLSSQPCQELSTISFISSPTPGGNGLTDTRGTTTTTTTTTTATASTTTMANNALLQGSSTNNNNIIIGSGLQSQQPQLSASFAATDLAGRPCARLNSDTTTTTTNYEDACAMPCSYPHNKAASSATFSSSATQELQNLSSLPALGALPQLDSAAAYMPSAIKPSTKAKREGNGDGEGGEEEEEEEEEERASIPFSALRALHAAHQCSMTSEACRPAAKATAPRDGGNNTPSATTALPSSAAAAAAATATTLRGLHVDILPAPQSARRGAMPVQGAHTSSNAHTGSTPHTIQRVDREVEEGRQGAAAVIGGAVGHRDAAAMAILQQQPQTQQEKQQPVHHQGHSPHFASAAATAVQHRKAAAPSPLRQGRQLAGRQGQPCGGQQPHHRRRRRPLVRLAHDGKTLIAGDFRVCEMGCLTIRNFLLLNPQHSQQDKGMSGTAATMPQLAEMRMAHGVAAAAMTFTAAESHGPGPLLRPERLCGMTIGSSVAATEEDRAVCEAMQATLGKSGVYDAGSGEAKPGQLLTRMDSGGSHVVGQACTAARGSQHAGVTIATTTTTRAGNTNTTAIVPDILLRSPVVSSPAITPTSAALTPDALLCPCISPGLLMMEEGGETDYGMTSTALPCYTPAMTTITPARTRGRSGTMHENASFTLQSTSMNMPYSPITYSMDSLHYPETMTPCTSKLGRTANTAGAGGTTTQTRRLLRARRELTPGLAHARYSGSLTNLIAQEAEPQLSRTTGQPPLQQQQYHGMAQGNLPGTPSCLRPSSAQMPHAMTPLIGSSAAPVLLQPQSSTTAFGTGLRVFRRCSSGGLNNFMNTTTTSNNTNNNNSSSGQVAGMQAFALGTGLPPQSPMSCLPAALAMSTTRGGTRPCAGNTTCANNGAVLGSSGGALMPSAAPSRALTATNTSLTLHGGDTPTSCTAGPLLPPPPPPPQPQPTHMHPASNAEDSMMVAGSLLPYVDIAPEQQRQQLLTAAQHAEVSAAVNTPLTRQRMMMSLQNVVRYGDLDIQLAVGEGASASVFLAIHRPTGRRLAVKRVNLEPLCLDARTAFGKSGNLFTYACDSARAQQLRYIIVRELQVLHLTYRSPFMVKVYNAFYLPDIAALDIVMEFMHYGSIDDLAKCLQRHARSEAQRCNTNTMSVDGEAIGKGKKEQQHEVGANDKQLQQQEGHEEASTQGAHTTPDTLATKKGNGSYAPSPHPAEAEAMALQTSEASYGCGGHRHHPRGTSLSGQLSPPVMPITDMSAAYKDSQIAAADAAAAVSVASPDIRVLPAPSSTPLSPDNGPAAVNAAVAELHDGPLQASVPHAVSADASASSSSPLLLSSALLSAAQREAQQRRNAKRPLPFALPTLAVSAVLTGAASSSGGSSTLDHTSDDLLSHRTHERQASLPGMEEEVCGVCERVVAVVGEQLLCGVRDMHARNFIHRDIKPGNVLVNEHAVVKLSDFGLSQRCSDAAGVKGRGAGRRQQQQQRHHHHHHSRDGSSRRTHRSGKRGRTSGTQQQQQVHHTGDEMTSMTAQRPLAEDSRAAAALLLQGQQRRSSVSLVASDNTRTASSSSSSSSSASVTTPASIVASSSSSSSSASSYNNNDNDNDDDDERKGCNGFAYRGGNDSHSDEDSNSSNSSTTATSDAMYGGGEEDEDEEEDDVHCSGTLNYMSPERLRGEPHGKPSDIWAVGVTLAEFAVGAYPYNLHDLTDIFDRLYRMEQPIDFAPFNVRRVTPLSAVFQDFIRLATLAAPSQRPTAHELLEHPFFKQWSTPFDLKSYLAARVPAPAPVTINSNGASRVKAAAQL